MACPSCGAEVGNTDWQTPSRGALAKATLLDWKTWAISFAIMALVGVILTMLDMTRTTGVGGGAAVGVVLAMRMGRLRGCPKCQAIVHPTQ